MQIHRSQLTTVFASHVSDPTLIVSVENLWRPCSSALWHSVFSENWQNVESFVRKSNADIGNQIKSRGYLLDPSFPITTSLHYNQPHLSKVYSFLDFICHLLINVELEGSHFVLWHFVSCIEYAETRSSFLQETPEKRLNYWIASQVKHWNIYPAAPSGCCITCYQKRVKWNKISIKVIK